MKTSSHARPLATALCAHLVFLLPAALAWTASPALAHSPPVAIGVLFEADTSDNPFVVGNRGLYHPGSDGWQLLCNEAYDVTPAFKPSVLQQMHGQRLLITNYDSVLRSEDRGCNSQNVVPVENRILTAALAAGPSPQSLWIATGNTPDDNTLFRSDDFGDSWQSVYDNASGQWFTGLVQAPTDAMRMYASTTSADLATQKLSYGIAASIDGGVTWTFADTDAKRSVLAVHPTNADIVFAQSQRTDTGEWVLYRSVDAGVTFTEVVSSPATYNALSLAPDGTSLWLGASLGAGLLASSDDGATFAPVSDTDITAVRCLQWYAGRLWMCANRLPNTEGVWSQPEGGGDWEPLLTVKDVTEPVSCSVPPESDVCDGPWNDWAYEEFGVPYPDGGTPAIDAGLADAGAPAVDADVVAPPTSDAGVSTASGASSGGCAATSPGPGPITHLAPFGLGLGLLGWRRRRARMGRPRIPDR